MREFDVKKLDTAMVYISRMADGRNPVNNEETNDEIINNPNVIRCLHFVLDVLRETRENDGVIGRKISQQKEPFPIEIIDQFVYREDQSISHLLNQFAEPAKDRNIRKPSAVAVNKWLGANGYLEKRMIRPGGKENWVPTSKGEASGLYAREGGMPGNEYVTVMYSQKGQMFLADHFEQILQEI
ncbi:MAG: hypothetical protein IJ121_11405 [Eubacterium sp.]|nr:hypothetical protein [Eubacterium sp.]